MPTSTHLTGGLFPLQRVMSVQLANWTVKGTVRLGIGSWNYLPYLLILFPPHLVPFHYTSYIPERARFVECQQRFLLISPLNIILFLLYASSCTARLREAAWVLDGFFIVYIFCIYGSSCSGFRISDVPKGYTVNYAWAMWCRSHKGLGSADMALNRPTDGFRGGGGVFLSPLCLALPLVRCSVALPPP